MNVSMVLATFLLYACGQKLDGDGDGFHELTNDCDDDNPGVSPAAIEICDGIDNDCNGEIDEFGAKGGTIFYVDLDGDGHGSENGTLEACSVPDGYSTSKHDCDESRSEVNPDADEICDGIDNDCDTHIDEYTAVDAPTWYPDRDGDGYGDMDAGILGCEAPPDYVLDGSDCDDVDPGVNRDASENCETPYDDDCNGELNEVDAFGCSEFYADLDGDGFGGTSLCLCEVNEEYSFDVGGDCNDQNALISPASEEVIDLIDNDCDGVAEYPLEQADVLLQLEAKNRRVTQLGGGDFNGDGLADILIGDVYADTISLMYGPDIPSGLVSENRNVIFYDTEEIIFSSNVIATLDATADGTDDVVLTHYGEGETINYVFAAPFADEVFPDDAVARIITDHDYRQMIRSDDINGDGFADVILSNTEVDGVIPTQLGTQDNLGQVAVFFSPITGDKTIGDADVVIVGDQEDHRLGEDVQSGDFNGDGLADIVASSLSNLYSPNFVGSLHFYTDVMTDEFSTSSSIVTTNAYFMRIGENLAKPADFNEDGHLDLALTNRPWGSQHGSTMVLYGPFLDGEQEISTLPLTFFYDYDSNYRSRHCVETTSDITGDGKADLLIGDEAHTEDNYGAVYLIHEMEEGFWDLKTAGTEFKSNYTTPSYTSGCRSGSFRRKFMSPGDVNGDGANDLLIAARQLDELDASIYSQVSLIWGVAQ